MVVPELTLAGGVKSKPLITPTCWLGKVLMTKLPAPVTVKSPTLPSHVKLVPGSSLKVKYTRVVCPAMRLVELARPVTVGATVSMLRLGEVPAVPKLPAVS